ncbi:hypothetical protein T265_15619, partial [Opisthorchis viverrini]
MLRNMGSLGALLEFWSVTRADLNVQSKMQVDFWRNVKIEGEITVSLGVCSLFTSVNLSTATLAVATVLNNQMAMNGPLGRERTCELPDLGLTTYFEFDGEYYEQLKIVPMGSPVSDFIMEVVTRQMERTVLPNIRPN